MSPTLNEVRSRRFRIKMWMTLLVPIAAAVPILLWAGINPFRRDPASAAIEIERGWAGQEGVESYQLYRGIDQGWESGRANCVVKLAYREAGPVGPPTPNEPFPSPARLAWITQNGGTGSALIRAQGGGGGWDVVDPATLTRARVLVASLPPAHPPVEPLRSLVVGSLQKGAWEVRIYDRDALPVEIEELIRLSGITDPH